MPNKGNCVKLGNCIVRQVAGFVTIESPSGERSTEATRRVPPGHRISTKLTRTYIIISRLYNHIWLLINRVTKHDVYVIYFPSFK